MYQVKDIQTSGIYAAKIFEIRGFDEKKLARAKTEIEAIKKLEGCAHIVQIRDENISAAAGGSTTELFYVMDYARHGSLDSNDFYIGDVQQCLRLFRQILMGVRDAHAKKVIHRDLKPGNILFLPTQRDIVINDFGLGLFKDRDPETAVTELDELLGPRHFMAPEQHLRPSETDERSDIYSLGKILYYMLTGKGKLYREKLDDINEMLSEANPYIPQIQDRLLGKMVVEKPGNRFAHVSEIIDEVDRILDQLDTNSRRFLKPSGQSVDVYGLLVGSEREDFIKSFEKLLDYSLWALEIVAEVLIKDRKTQTLEALKSALLETYPSGRVNVAILSVLHFTTDAKQLATLQRKSRHSFPSYYLARYYLESRDFDTAHGYIIKALAAEKNPALQLRYLLVFEKVCRKCSCQLPHDYDDRIKKILRSSKEPEATDLLQTLGEHYLKSEGKLKGLRFLEAYLSRRPYDDQARWTCAYGYSELGQVSLSLHHYSIYATHKPDDASTINNMGVAYTNKGLHVSALEKFREAYALGNTLAGANIASKYITAGMVDEAKRLLDEIVASHPGGDYDDSVAAHLGTIVSMQTKEKETREGWEAESGLVNTHNIQATKAIIKYSNSSWLGRWEMAGECTFECAADEAGKIRVDVINDGFREAILVAIPDEGCLDISHFKKGYGDEYVGGVLYLDLANSDTFKGYLQSTRGDYKMVDGKRLTT